ncbi:MAG: DNA modification methylase, partial [Myxococcaceae bacterium]|nr:DNA modification methylase [Myxococcaceae bacterium]
MDTLVIRRVPLASLTLDPANARQHGERNLEAIQASLKRFGQAEPLVVQRATGRVVGGNGRLVAMKALGWTEADVVELDLTETQATALGIALNRTAELAEWDLPALGRLLESLHADHELEGVGFSEDELQDVLDEILADNPIEVNEDEVPAFPDAATTRRGDLWVLGRHRLLCGDSSRPEDLDRLLSGEPIHLVNTDPPYNVKVEPRSNNAIAAGLSSFAPSTHHQKLDLARHPEKRKATHQKLRAKDRPLANDFVSDEEFDRLLRAWFGNAARALLPGRGFYIWGGYANLANYPAALKEMGLYFSQAIVWNKLHPVLTRKDFMGAFELAFYGWKEGAAHEYFGPNNATDLWEVKKVNPQAMCHLTEKPVELAARAIQYSSRPGEHVLDLFGGSGSTLVAAEQTGRRAFLVELDELYADVI